MNKNISKQAVNIGHSSRLAYDSCYINDSIKESVAPLNYYLSPDQIYNCDNCLSVFGPRGATSGISSPVKSNYPATSQTLVDVESILSNRNVLASRCKDGQVNDVNVNDFTLRHHRICSDFIDPIASHLTNPPQNYRGMSINRFYDLPKNPQANIFWDFSVNTQLEAKDNYEPVIPKLIDNSAALPKEKPVKYLKCVCPENCSIAANWWQ